MSDVNSNRIHRILVLYFSQTGQLTSAVRMMMSPLEDRPDFEVVWQEIKPVRPYPFPWTFLEFLDVFPESVHMDPPEIEPVDFDPDGRFDLIIIAYQVWFLSPSLPVTGFLKSPSARVLKGAPVITLIVCRNMWLIAQEKMKDLLKKKGATLIDNVVIVDQGPPWATFITTPRWLLTGSKNGFWGIFPPAGVHQRDIKGAARFGRAIADGLSRMEGPPSSSLLCGLGAVRVNPGYILGERMAHRSFYIWGKLIKTAGHPGQPLRRMLLLIFVVFLITMILTVVPLGIIIRAALKPFLRKRFNTEIERLEGPTGSSTERISQYV